MASVGDYLRALRDRRGTSLEEISRVTRVGSSYLEALESDRFAALPAPVFTRGFIRAYCQALGESPDEALARYDGREGGAPVTPRPTAGAGTPAPVAESEPRSRSAVLVSFVLLVILGMALFAVALMTQPAREERVERRMPSASERAPSSLPAPTSPSASEPSSTASAPAGSSTASGPGVPGPTSAAPPVPAGAAVTTEAARASAPPPWLGDVQAATGGVASPYRLVARVSEPTWIRVRTEDGRSTEETVPAGEIREWVSNRPFVLTLGNAGGVTLELNGRTLPPLGPSGAVISRIVLPPQ
jgi:cytoskeleton protein RodZ